VRGEHEEAVHWIAADSTVTDTLAPSTAMPARAASNTGAP
jgi:hypothetical protein